jgi:predicted Zn-dependent protease
MPRRAILPLLLAVACTSVNPATGRREVVLMSTEEERAIDAREAKRVESQLGLVTDPELNEYVDAIGQALAEHSPRQDLDYHFQIIEADEPNAFALPGGHVYVSRGLLTVANSEAEIANVLGHEIGHVAARHAAQRQAHVQTFGLATLLSDLMGGGPRAQPDSEPLSGHFVARYARNQEREADRIGQDLALEAGVDPRGLAEFMRTLDNLSRIEQGFSTPQSYLATHPAARERMLEASTRAWRTPETVRESWKPGLPVAHTREQFLERIEGIAVGRPASEGIFIGDRFLHPDLDFSLRFPSGWDLENQSSQVVGLAPKRDGVVLLQLDGIGDDPAAAARAFAEREKLALENPTPIRIGGLPAFRAESVVETQFGKTHAEITWVAHDGRVYRLVTGNEPGSLRKYQGLFRKFAHSFRPLTPEDRLEITELRLRIAHARPGETLEALCERTGNEWSPFHTAVANGLQVGAALPGGTPVKIALREPYQGPREPRDLVPATGPAAETASGR